NVLVNMWKRSACSYHCRRKKRGKKRHHNGTETKVRFCCLDFTRTGRIFPNGIRIFPNGGSIFSNGVSIFPNGGSIFSNGGSIFPNGGSIFHSSLFPGQ
ncbi:MAG: hypothetical protein K6D37_07230, partial [Prevotella sp.]|nr:hypothetical protein [Prevotella sp.]